MRHILPVLLATAALAAAGVASAQPPAPGAPPSREGRREEWAARRQAHQAREVADLSTVLRLRPEQQTGLRAWLEAGRGGKDGRRGPMGDRAQAGQAPPTTAQTLDREAARLSEREMRERAHLDATRRFYASLSPDQQASFDALERLRHGHGGLRGGFGGHGMMRMGERRGGPGGPDAGAPPPPRVGD